LVLRQASRPPDWRTRRAKAQPLELQLRIQFCACLFSVRVHRCAISQRDGWRMFLRMRLRLGTVAKISRNFFCFGNRTLRRIILYTRLNFLPSRPVASFVRADASLVERKSPELKR